MATLARQRAQAAAAAAIARAQAHIRTKAEPEDSADDKPITPDVARQMRLRTEGVKV